MSEGEDGTPSPDEEERESTDLQVGLELFIGETAKVHAELSMLKGRPTQDDEVGKRVELWKRNETRECRKAIQSWGDQCVHLMSTFWKHHISQAGLSEKFDDDDIDLDTQRNYFCWVTKCTEMLNLIKHFLLAHFLNRE